MVELVKKLFAGAIKGKKGFQLRVEYAKWLKIDDTHTYAPPYRLGTWFHTRPGVDG